MWQRKEIETALLADLKTLALLAVTRSSLAWSHPMATADMLCIQRPSLRSSSSSSDANQRIEIASYVQAGWFDLWSVTLHN